MAATGFKITYATMSADSDELQQDYRTGIALAKSWFGKDYPFYVNGEERRTGTVEEERSPIDDEILIGRFEQARAEDVDDAVAAARASARSWEQTPWKERVDILGRAADLISERVYELSAVVA